MQLSARRSIPPFMNQSLWSRRSQPIWSYRCTVPSLPGIIWLSNNSSCQNTWTLILTSRRCLCIDRSKTPHLWDRSCLRVPRSTSRRIISPAPCNPSSPMLCQSFRRQAIPYHTARPCCNVYQHLSSFRHHLNVCHPVNLFQLVHVRPSGPLLIHRLLQRQRRFPLLSIQILPPPTLPSRSNRRGVPQRGQATPNVCPPEICHLTEITCRSRSLWITRRRSSSTRTLAHQRRYLFLPTISQRSFPSPPLPLIQSSRKVRWRRP